MQNETLHGNKVHPTPTISIYPQQQEWDHIGFSIVSGILYMDFNTPYEVCNLQLSVDYPKWWKGDVGVVYVQAVLKNSSHSIQQFLSLFHQRNCMSITKKGSSKASSSIWAVNHFQTLHFPSSSNYSMMDWQLFTYSFSVFHGNFVPKLILFYQHLSPQNVYEGFGVFFL